MDRPYSTSNSTRPVLRIGATRGVPAVLRELGEQPTKLISEAGLSPRIFDNPDNQLSLHARGALLVYCSNVTGCPHFGLLSGQKVGLESLGLLGLLVKHSPDVVTALRRLSRYFHLQASGVAVDLTLSEGTAVFSYGIYEPDVPGVDQTSDGALAAMLNIMRGLCGPDFKATQVWFAHGPPQNTEPYREFFKARLRFDTKINALVFSSTWLFQSLPETEPDLTHLLQNTVEELVRKNPQTFPDQVQSVMRTALAFSHIRADQVAAMLLMHVRTYHRQLARCGTSHQECLDKTRFAVATQFLEGSSLTVSKISELLDFSEPRSFNRAFLRWSGMTPAQWRIQSAAKTDVENSYAIGRGTLRL